MPKHTVSGLTWAKADATSSASTVMLRNLLAILTVLQLVLRVSQERLQTSVV